MVELVGYFLHCYESSRMTVCLCTYVALCALRMYVCVRVCTCLFLHADGMESDRKRFILLLFYFILFYFILFYFLMFCLILFIDYKFRVFVYAYHPPIVVFVFVVVVVTVLAPG